MSIRLRLLDAIVEIEAGDETAERLLRRLWQCMETDEPGVPVRKYELTREDGRWQATAGGDLEAVHETLWGVTDALRYRMLEVCEEHLRRFVTLHAAALARDDRLVLLAGPSGAGKSTLTLALLDAGWSYVTDDLAPIEVETGLVHPFPKPLGVKDPARWESLRRAFDGLDPIEPPAGAFLVPPTPWPVAPGPLAVAALVFPTYVPGASLEVQELTSAKAAAFATAYVRDLEPSRVALLNRMCTGAACYHMEHGDAAAAVGALERIAAAR